MNTITRRERRTYIGKHLSCIKTATDFCLLFVWSLHRRDFDKRMILKVYSYLNLLIPTGHPVIQIL
jgi:hypothetical protein